MGNLGSAPCLSPLICLLMGKSLRRFSWYTQVMTNYKKPANKNSSLHWRYPTCLLPYIHGICIPQLVGRTIQCKSAKSIALLQSPLTTGASKLHQSVFWQYQQQPFIKKIKHQNASFYYTSYSQTHNSLQTWLLNSSRLFCKTTLKILTNISCLD